MPRVSPDGKRVAAAIEEANGQIWLYDLARDPGEAVNLAAGEAPRVAALTRLIDQRFASLPRRAHPQQIPEKLRKELSNLGYVAP